MNLYLYVLIGMAGSFLLAGALLFFYLRYKRRLHQQQYRIQAAELSYQRKLTEEIIESQEKERKQIGKELHDDVGNALASLRMYLDKHFSASAPDAVREEYNKRINTIFHKVRTISHQLSVVEIELFGLRDAVFILGENMSVEGVLAVHIDESGAVIPDSFDRKTAVIIYRILQELLTNTVKHAQAQDADIRFRSLPASGELLIEYRDNGKGIASQRLLQGMGFKNMESRLQSVDGKWELKCEDHSGFAINIYIPLNINTEPTN